LSPKNKHHKRNYHDNKKEIISIVCRSIKPRYEKDYDDWLRRYLNLKRNVVGYLGTTVIIPGCKRLNMRYSSTDSLIKVYGRMGKIARIYKDVRRGK
jgi:antibiotic biosynthesis monooxygenase (ABM) superfamily enzyme